MDKKKTQKYIDPQTIIKSIREGEGEVVSTDAPKKKFSQDIIDAVKKSDVDLHKKYDTGALVLSFQNIPVGTLGNLCCIVGKQKSRKSSLLTLIAEAAMRKTPGQINVFKQPGKERVLWLDTEQEVTDAQRCFRKAVYLSGKGTKYKLEVKTLREHNVAVRKEMIEYYLTEGNPNNDIAMVLIDGVKELLSDINDTKEATSVCDFLMSLSTKQQLLIIVVIHMNKGDKNARGHIGTELMNKCQTIISVTKPDDNPNISIVEANETRKKPFAPFAFELVELDGPVGGWDLEGLPEVIDYPGGGYSGAKKKGPQDITEEDHRMVMAKIFNEGQEFGRGDLINQAEVVYAECGFSVGRRNLGICITKCAQLKIIKKGPGHRDKYQLNQ